MEEIDKRLNNAILMRGRILQEASIFEKMLDVFLSMYYSQKGKQSAFMHIFLSKTELRRKKQIFVETVELYENEFKSRNPNFLTDLEQIIKTRNVMAHEVLEPAGEIESYDGSLTFDNYKKKRIITTFSKDEIEKEIDLVIKYSLEIQLLIVG